MTSVVVNLLCFLWIFTALLNILFLGKELPIAVRKRNEALGGLESVTASTVHVVTRFLLIAPYFYARYTAKYIALTLFIRWKKYSARQRDRKRDKKQ